MEQKKRKRKKSNRKNRQGQKKLTLNKDCKQAINNFVGHAL